MMLTQCTDADPSRSLRILMLSSEEISAVTSRSCDCESKLSAVLNNVLIIYSFF